MFDFDFWASFIIISLIWLLSLFLFLRTNKKKRTSEQAGSDDKLNLAKLFLAITSFVEFFFLVGTIGLTFAMIFLIPPFWIISLVYYLKMKKKKRLDPNIVSSDSFFEDIYALATLLLGISSFFLALLLICIIGLIILSFFPISFM